MPNLPPSLLKSALLIFGILAFSCIALAQQVPGMPRTILSEQDYAANHHNDSTHTFFYPRSFYGTPEQDNAAEINVRPMLFLSGGAGNKQLGLVHENAIGLGTELLLGKKMRLWFNPLYYTANYTSYWKNFVDQTGVLPNFGRARNGAFGKETINLTGALAYSPSKYFTLEIGNNRNHWGDGHRSLVLGDYTAPYPYAKIGTKFWKVEYQSVFTKMEALQFGMDQTQFRDKYVALHAISLNVGKKWNFSVFESVVWQGSDTLSNRGFEFNYLNPVIFYRPVEFYQGSADNVLLGAGGKWKATDRVQFYFQLMLDEFLLKQVREGDGWWANKVAVQFGAKYYDAFTKGLHLQSEVNFARPFTYTHGSALQNYGHLNQSFAHPLGTNFVEWLSLARYETEKWEWNGQFNWSIFGRDLNDENYGGNIFRPYTSPKQEFNNKVAQGDRSTLFYARLQVDYSAFEKMGLSVFARGEGRWERRRLGDHNDFYLSLGVRMNFLPAGRGF